MGESAGASSILHHLTSWNGEEAERPKFSQAIMESPAFFPQPDKDPVDEAYVEFQVRAKAFSLYHLKMEESSKVMEANARMNYESDYGIFRFGPTTYEPDHPVLPGLALKNNNYYHNISLITGHSLLDGLLFAPPWVRNDDLLKQHIREMYPKFDCEALDKVTEMYPIGARALPRTAIGTVFDVLDDVAISCNNVYLSEAAVRDGHDSYYRYVLNAAPAPIHGLFPAYVVSILVLYLHISMPSVDVLLHQPSPDRPIVLPVRWGRIPPRVTTTRRGSRAQDTTQLRRLRRQRTPRRSWHARMASVQQRPE
jgi:carboxylesterase type B